MGHDINVTGVWENNVTGHGVVVSVIDDGKLITEHFLRPGYPSLTY